VASASFATGYCAITATVEGSPPAISSNLVVSFLICYFFFYFRTLTMPPLPLHSRPLLLPPSFPLDALSFRHPLSGISLSNAGFIIHLRQTPFHSSDREAFPRFPADFRVARLRPLPPFPQIAFQLINDARSFSRLLFFFFIDVAPLPITNWLMIRPPGSSFLGCSSF